MLCGTWNMNTAGTWTAATFQLTSPITVKAFYALRRRLGRFTIVHRGVRTDHTGSYMEWEVLAGDLTFHIVNFKLVHEGL